MKKHHAYFCLSQVKFFIATFSIAFSYQASARPTISGISSGGFMAVQMATIFSDQFDGVGSVAGGYFYCAENHLNDKISEGRNFPFTGAKNLFLYSQSPKNFQNLIDPMALFKLDATTWFEPAQANPIYRSVAVCMHNPELGRLPDLADFVKQKKIHSLDHFKNLKVFIYQGENDRVVKKEMAQQLVSFYTNNGIAKENILNSETSGGHNFPTDKIGLNSCNEQDVPYVSSCQLDAAGLMLEHLLSSKLEKSEPILGNLYVVDQNLKRTNISRFEEKWQAPIKSLAAYGYLYAPKSCLDNPASCRTHVALHGCEMSDSFNANFDKLYVDQVKKYQSLPMRTKKDAIFNYKNLPIIEDKENKYGTLTFALKSGYIEYAEKNNLMILFPQTWLTEDNYPYNPKACWDWFGWTGRDYATLKGAETSWLMKYIKAVSANPQSFILPVRPHFSEAPK